MPRLYEQESLAFRLTRELDSQTAADRNTQSAGPGFDRIILCSPQMALFFGVDCRRAAMIRVIHRRNDDLNRSEDK